MGRTAGASGRTRCIARRRDDLLALLRGQVADWWIPDEIAEVAAMPLAATGKIDKARLRADLTAGLLVADAA